MPERNYKIIIKPLLTIAFVIVLLYLFYLLGTIIIIIAISLLLAFIFAPFVTLLEGRGLRRLTATIITLAVFGFIIYLGLSILIPKFIVQMDQLVTAFQGFSFDEQMNALEAGVVKYFPFFNEGELTKKIEEFISNQIVNSAETITVLVSSIFSIAAVLVIVPFITFFFLKDSKRILQGILHLMPNRYFEMSYWVLKKVSLQLGLFVRAWIFDATFVGVMIGLGFYFAGINNALPLGVIAGLGHLIPYFGPIIGGVPALIISIVQYGDLSQLPIITFVVLVTYAVDNGLVQPYVFGKSVDMHPIAIILLIIAGGQLFGLIGMLLAIPAATVVKTFAKEIYFATKNYKIAKV